MLECNFHLEILSYIYHCKLWTGKHLVSARVVYSHQGPGHVTSHLTFWYQ